MNWTIEYAPRALKGLRALDKPIRRRIMDYLDVVACLEDPRCRGKALTGALAGLWRYRVGDWRLVCDIRDDRLVIVSLRIDHRSRIYG